MGESKVMLRCPAHGLPHAWPSLVICALSMLACDDWYWAGCPVQNHTTIMHHQLIGETRSTSSKRKAGSSHNTLCDGANRQGGILSSTDLGLGAGKLRPGFLAA